MNAPSCPECTAALQKVVHRVYAEGCYGCTWRALAYMPADERERYFDKVCHLCGPRARDELRRNVDLERARIAHLAQLMPKRERATT